MMAISVMAFMAYALVLARCIHFSLWDAPAGRQDDRTEVAFMLAASSIYMIAQVGVWVLEPESAVDNTSSYALLVGFTIFVAAYFHHRVGCLIIGRNRRHDDRRGQPQ